MRKLTVVLLPVVISLSSCFGYNRTPPPPPPKLVWGFKPVFTVDSSVLEVRVEQPRSVVYPGKIYAKGNLVFQTEVGHGIHVYDNSNPEDMKAVGFIKVLGCSEISIRGNYLYTNSFTDLVVVDISDWQQVKQTARIKNAFYQGIEAYQAVNLHQFIPPPEHGVFYDCSEFYFANVTSILTGWVRDSIYDNNCFYP